MDPAEVSSVHRIPIDDLVAPTNRCRVRHPSGYVGPGFEVDGLLVWGFTAGLLDGVLEGAALPSHHRVLPGSEGHRTVTMRSADSHHRFGKAIFAGGQPVIFLAFRG